MLFATCTETYCIYVCRCWFVHSILFVLSLSLSVKAQYRKNLLRRQQELPCQLSCPEPALSSLFSLFPLSFPSSSAPLIGPLSGWWEDMLSSDGNAAQLTMLCVRARLRQGREKNIPIRRGGLRVCVCACVYWQVLEYAVLLPAQREHAKHRGEILINTEASLLQSEHACTAWAEKVRECKKKRRYRKRRGGGEK